MENRTSPALAGADTRRLLGLGGSWSEHLGIVAPILE